jgi:hypothetical protein
VPSLRSRDNVPQTSWRTVSALLLQRLPPARLPIEEDVVKGTELEPRAAFFPDLHSESTSAESAKKPAQER